MQARAPLGAFRGPGQGPRPRPLLFEVSTEQRKSLEAGAGGWRLRLAAASRCLHCVALRRHRRGRWSARSS